MVNLKKLQKTRDNCEKFVFTGRLFTLIALSSTLFFFSTASAQSKLTKGKTTAAKTALPKVKKIDAAALKNLLKPNGKPLLINFWATWCDPCREEFPDLVKIGADYKGKVDLMTISLDELSEIDNEVPKFLADMKAQSTGYLLKTDDEGAAIASVSKDWQGGLPFTILFNTDGKAIYAKQGKFNDAFLRNEIDKVLSVSTAVNAK